MSNTRKQKAVIALQRLFSTAEGLKVSLPFIGLIIAAFPLIFGNAEPMALVLVVTAFVWGGWKSALAVAGVSTLAGLFTRNLLVGIMMFFIAFPFIIMIWGLGKALMGSLRYVAHEVEYIFS